MGLGSGSRAAPLAWVSMVAIIAAVGFLLAAGSAAAAGQPEPPTAAQVQKRTEAFLETYGSAPRVLRGGGGVGADPEDPGDNGGNGPLLGKNFAVALYGAPQLTATAVGKRSPGGAARKLRKQAARYTQSSKRPVVRSINLIGVIATASAGSDGKYRTRQSDGVIRRYLKAARSIDARLTLDIQPGRSPLMRELRAMRKWIALPDVDVGIDPEWNVGRKGVPGRTEGSVTWRELNKASSWIERVVADEGVPAKAMIVHQFREGSIKGRSKVRQRADADVLLNFDGIGSRRAKKAGYKNLVAPKLLGGFSLFYDRDTDLLSPRGVLGIRPTVEYAMYQ